MEKFDRASSELRKVTDSIKNSQRFGQPLPSGTTVGWATKLESIAVEFNEAFAAIDDPAASASNKTTTGLVKDFNVIAKYG